MNIRTITLSLVSLTCFACGFGEAEATTTTRGAIALDPSQTENASALCDPTACGDYPTTSDSVEDASPPPSPALEDAAPPPEPTADAAPPPPPVHGSVPPTAPTKLVCTRVAPGSCAWRPASEPVSSVEDGGLPVEDAAPPPLPSSPAPRK